MGYRNWDWVCKVCGAKESDLVWVEFGERTPASLVKYCEYCDQNTKQEKAYPLPAKYTGECMANFDVYGGKFDTMGHKSAPALPEMPGLNEYHDRVKEYTKSLPEMPIKQLHQEISKKFKNEGPQLSDVAEHFRKGEVKEVQAERVRVKEENAEKKARARAIKKGDNINMRNDKCKGDPKLME